MSDSNTAPVVRIMSGLALEVVGGVDDEDAPRRAVRRKAGDALESSHLADADARGVVGGVVATILALVLGTAVVWRGLGAIRPRQPADEVGEGRPGGEQGPVSGYTGNIPFNGYAGQQDAGLASPPS